MELLSASSKYTIAKGFINGRDGSSRSVFALFVAAVSASGTAYLKELFTYETIDTEAPWETLLAMLEAPKPQDRDADLARYEHEFHEFIDINRPFYSTKGHLDAKQIERKISYFCSDILDISAITFLDLSEVGAADLYALFPSLMESANAPAKTGAEAAADDRDEEKLTSSDVVSSEPLSDEEKGEIFAACEPVLDPVSGVALSDLQIGDVVACRLPETSTFYKFCMRGYPKFDGTLSGVITGIHLDEYGTATVALKLADGVSGALRLSGKVRIKILAKGADVKRTTLSIEVVLAFSSVIVFLGIMGVLLYKLS